MSQFYNILKAEPAGDPWEARGGMYQTWFLTIEGHVGTTLVNRKTSSPTLSGRVYGDLIEGVTKKGGKKWTFKVEPQPELPLGSPQTSPEALQGPSGSQMTSDTVTWSTALLAASTLRFVESIDQMEAIANQIYRMKPYEPEPVDDYSSSSDDFVVKDVPNESINLDDIPF